jgi:hypothetical protein
MVFYSFVTLPRDISQHALYLQGKESRDSAVADAEYKQTPWPLVRLRTIPTDRLPLVDEI